MDTKKKEAIKKALGICKHIWEKNGTKWFGYDERNVREVQM